MSARHLVGWAGVVERGRRRSSPVAAPSPDRARPWPCSRARVVGGARSCDGQPCPSMRPACFPSPLNREGISMASWISAPMREKTLVVALEMMQAERASPGAA
ncbi:unnamed protein product [Urochloa humidicola]